MVLKDIISTNLDHSIFYYLLIEFLMAHSNGDFEKIYHPIYHTIYHNSKDDFEKVYHP